jgi:NADH-quinone oxidoreductase subunit H
MGGFVSFHENLVIILTVIAYLLLIISLLMGIAFFTLFERQLLAALQRRQGPNVVGFFGLLQPITDGVKLLLKESIIPKSANGLIFLFAPIFTFGLALAG